MHTIRLRGPWEKQFSSQADYHRVRIPESSDSRSHASLASPIQSARYRRKFNMPTGLETGARVFLDVRGFEGELAQVLLNDEPVAMETLAKQHARAEVTRRLQPHNELELTLQPSEEECVRLCGEVSLQIEA